MREDNVHLLTRSLNGDGVLMFIKHTLGSGTAGLNPIALFLYTHVHQWSLKDRLTCGPKPRLGQHGSLTSVRMSARYRRSATRTTRRT